MTSILVVDDEVQLRRFLTISLSSQGYDVLEARDGANGLSTAALEKPDLIVLDLGLPDQDGQTVLSRLRDFYQGPIIVLSVRNSEQEKIRALDSGCNDYVEKPFGIKELLARIRAALRTFSGIEVPPAIYDDGHLYVDLSERQVRLEQKVIRLSKKEFDLLKLLVTAPGRVLTQQSLLHQLWGQHHEADTHYLRILVGKLRAKLNDDPTDPRYIETETGIGYRFHPHRDE